jgi:excisionase family DNA binding protein
MLSTTDAAELLGLQPATLATWREDGSQADLPFYKFGKIVRYRYSEVVAFIETHRASSTLAARRFQK